ncbi:GNAT family N-acetyltransferase [Dokdonella sp.]|uniref:GNAT family N-acetyltransferase n=1 Tax=Dokdonella sp. TaxID=2291710 RepID=UPI001B2E9449|nr:GNAT family N-acetyltransferase [Dokdonella sp.]MBO9664557.1 GNAT family N-acetyltransferase [Dokdonella sp.]
MRTPSDTLRLRQAHSTDRAALVQLLHRTWERTFAPQLPHGASQRYFADAVAERYVDEEWPRFVVAERQGDLVGFADADEALIASLHVDPAVWGLGIGRRLLDECERRIAAGGHRVARLQVEAFNTRAFKFYCKAGYVEIDRRPDEEFDSGGLSVFMAKPLRSGDEQVRQYRPQDRAACLALFESNVPEYFAEAERADFIDQLDNLEGPYLVVGNGGAVVACGGFQADRKDPSIAALCWGMVRRDLHGSRLGEALLVARLDLIATNPAFESVVIETTPMSRGFFERYGFVAGRVVADGFVPGYDLVEMTLRLDRLRAGRR